MMSIAWSPIVEDLYQKAAEPSVSVEIEEPMASGAPITITVTGGDASDRRDIYTVDPETKLLTGIHVVSLVSRT